MDKHKVTMVILICCFVFFGDLSMAEDHIGSPSKSYFFSKYQWDPSTTNGVRESAIKATLTATHENGVVTLDIRQSLRGPSGHIYNPFFNTLIAPGCALMLFDMEHAPLDVYGIYVGGSRRDADKEDWVWTGGARSYVGHTLSLAKEEPDRSGRIDWTCDRLPKKFFVQVLIFDSAATSPPFPSSDRERNAEAMLEWKKRYGYKEIGRSNVVEIDLDKEEGSKTPQP